MSCILSKFYIKPQLRIYPQQLPLRCILSKFYIKPQQQVQTLNVERGCILSKFYIKPQLAVGSLFFCVVVSYRNSTSNHNHIDTVRVDYMLYLIEILHQTTTCGKCEDCLRRCILSKFYIKPQHSPDNNMNLRVVSYRNSTSNHNYLFCHRSSDGLYLIEILHQTTTRETAIPCLQCCILSKFYIKPQHNLRLIVILLVVSYRNSTSNHNSPVSGLWCHVLYLIEILHQTTTSGLILIDKVLLTGCLPL